jgi:putative nucleotidyltransferase with HDIG domain
MEGQTAQPFATPRMGWRAFVFVAVTIALGALVCAYALWDVFTRPLSTEWLILLALTFIAGGFLKVTGAPVTFSISDTFSIVATLIAGPSAGALTAAVDGFILSIRMSKTRFLHRVLFNLASTAIATWVAGTLFQALAGAHPVVDGPVAALRLLGLLTMLGAVAYGLNSGLVAVAVSFERRQPLLTIWRENFGSFWVSYLGAVFAAMLVVVLPRTSTLEILILIAPLPVILYVTLRHVLGRASDQIGHLEKMNKVYLSTIEALAQAVDAKDQVTHDHVRRVQDNALLLAKVLDLHDDEQLQAIKAASLLHDIGKIAIPEHILNKPGRLTPSEFEIMKRHAPIGADILAVIGFPYPVVPIVRHHHENWDGSGYPDGLAGEAIPIGARILQVVDCFDALTSDRPYRPRMDDEEALQILMQRRGTMYDPRVVDALLNLRAASALSAAAPEEADCAPEPPSCLPAPRVERAENIRDTLPLEILCDLGRALATPLSATHMGDTLWTQLRSRLSASAFVLFVYDVENDALVPAYRAGKPTIAATARIPVGERLSGWVAATRRTVVNSDARLDLDPEQRENTSLRSALAVPAIANGQLVGVLAFYATHADAFDETHQRFAEAAAYAAASGLHIVAPRVAALAV